MLRRRGQSGSVAVETALTLLLLLVVSIGTLDFAFGMWLRSGLRFSTVNYARHAAIYDAGRARELVADCELIAQFLETWAKGYHRQQLATSHQPSFDIRLQQATSNNMYYLSVNAQQEAPCFLCKLANIDISVYSSSMERIESEEFNCV